MITFDAVMCLGPPDPVNKYSSFAILKTKMAADRHLKRGQKSRYLKNSWTNSAEFGVLMHNAPPYFKGYKTY